MATSNYSNMPYARSNVDQSVSTNETIPSNQASSATLSNFGQSGYGHSMLFQNQYSSTTLSSFAEKYPLHGQNAPKLNNHPSDGKNARNFSKDSRRDHHQQRANQASGPSHSNLRGGAHNPNPRARKYRRPSRVHGPGAQMRAAQHSTTTVVIRGHNPIYVHRPGQAQAQKGFPHLSQSHHALPHPEQPHLALPHHSQSDHSQQPRYGQSHRAKTQNSFSQHGQPYKAPSQQGQFHPFNQCDPPGGFFNLGFDPDQAELDPFRQRQPPPGRSSNGFPDNHGAISRMPAALTASTMAVERLIQPPYSGLLPYDMFDPGWKLSPKQHGDIMSDRDPRFPATPLRHPWNIGPPLYMTAEQYKATLEWNSVYPLTPNFFNGIPNYYSGPLHYTTAGQAIMMFADFGKRTHDESMLEPFVLPLNCFLPDTDKESIYVNECRRHKQLMEEVLAIPRQPGWPGNSIYWFRIMGDMRLRPEMIAWHPKVIDLFGHASQYERLLELDVNGRNNNEKGVGRKNSPLKPQNTKGTATKLIKSPQSQSQNTAAGVRKVQEPTQAGVREGLQNQTQMDASAASGPSKAETKVQKTPITGVDVASQRPPTTLRTSEDSDETSVLFREDAIPVNPGKLQYIGYSIRGEEYRKENPVKFKTPANRHTRFDGSRLLTEHDMKRQNSPEVSPTTGGSRRGVKPASASQTPLLDFDRHWSATKGDDRDVDFAIRDKGPPRFSGKTFNEAINYTPDPRERPQSAGAICYGVPFGYRPPRD